MELKSKRIIVSVIMVIVFLLIGMSLETLATTGGNLPTYSFGDDNTNNTNFSGNGSTIPQTTTNNNVNNTNTNNPSQLANTGLEDWPWAIIAVCAVSTVFAYKKIKEYRED